MANHSSTKKSIRKTIKNTAINKNRKTRIKTLIKKVLLSIESSSSEDSTKQIFIKLQSEIAKASQRKLIPQNRASRILSRLSAKIKKSKSAQTNLKAS